MADPVDPVFDVTKCDVAPVEPIPAGNWLVDDTVPQAPEDIADCPTTPIPLPPPEPPCPAISVNPANVTWDVVPVGSEQVTLQVTKGNCCDFDFEIDVDFPCPAFPQLGTSSGSSQIVPVGSEDIRVTFLAAAGGVCGFDFDIAADFPCPTFPQSGTVSGAVTVVPVGAEEVRWTFSPSGTDCGFDFDLEVDFPCPAIAGVFPGTINKVAVGSEAVTLTITSTGTCEFDFAVDIDYSAVCPQIGPASVVAVKSVVPVGSEAFSLSIVKSEGCSFEFEAEIAFPCPAIAGVFNGSITKVPSGTGEHVILTISPALGSDCGFDFDIDVQYESTCPQLAVTTTNIGIVPIGSQNFELQITKSIIDACSFDFEIDIDFPCPQFPFGSGTGASLVVPIGSEAVRWTITTATDCGFDFAVDVDFPCPQFPLRTDTANKRIVPVGSELIRWTFSPSPTDCGFDFDLDVDFPCPTLAGIYLGTASKVTPGNESATLIITSTGDCDFDFDVSVNFTDTCPQMIGVYPGSITKVPSGTGEHAILTVTSIGDCAFDFDVDIQYESVCPQLSVGTSTVSVVPVGSESFLLTINKSLTECAFDFEVDIAFPCPQMDGVYAGSITKNAPGDGQSVTLTVTKSADCSFDFDIDIQIEIDESCPVINPVATVFQSTVAAGSESFALVINKDPLSCSFDFVATIAFPCPNIAGTYTGTVTRANFGGDPNSLVMTITQVLGSCDFDFELDLTYQAGCPTINDPVVNYSIVPVGSEDFTFLITKNDLTCTFDFDIDIGFPCPQLIQGPNLVQFEYEYIGCDVTPSTPQATGGLVVHDLGGCRYELYLDLTVPIQLPDCGPRNTVMFLSVFGQPTGGTFELYLRLNSLTETITIGWGDSQATVATALATHSQLALTDISISGGGSLPAYSMRIEFVGAWATRSVDVPAAGWGSLTGGYGVGVFVFKSQDGHP